MIVFQPAPCVKQHDPFIFTKPPRIRQLRSRPPDGATFGSGVDPLFLRQFTSSVMGAVDVPALDFAARMESLTRDLERLSQPRATVMCTLCMIDVP